MGGSLADSLPAETLSDVTAFLSYWDSLPKSDHLPRLSDYFDRVPPHLQPNVVIADVLSRSESKIRLVGTNIVRLAGADETGAPLNLVYADAIRQLMAKLAWEIVTRPVGYLCMRRVRTGHGVLVDCPAIALPLRSAGKSIVSYYHVPEKYRATAVDDRWEFVQELRVTHWLDLGAGTPDGFDSFSA